mmetsp:Transcript_15069/g.24959  ORF Transcript_15069/g.24959 Transcript_15069/m.24959 type:complete len:200 (-) Transcript_15069:1450-2049(-)
MVALQVIRSMMSRTRPLLYLERVPPICILQSMTEVPNTIDTLHMPPVIIQKALVNCHLRRVTQLTALQKSSHARPTTIRVRIGAMATLRQGVGRHPNLTVHEILAKKVGTGIAVVGEISAALVITSRDLFETELAEASEIARGIETEIGIVALILLDEVMAAPAPINHTVPRLIVFQLEAMYTHLKEVVELIIGTTLHQ